MVRAHRHGLRARFKSSIVPVEHVAGVGASTDAQGVLALATKGGEMANRFGDFCRKHLCQESWDFIADAMRYERMVRTRRCVLVGYTMRWLDFDSPPGRGAKT